MCGGHELVPMNKQELIHLHGLVLELARYCETEGELHVDLDRYHELGTNPHPVQQSKRDHQEAMFAVVDGLTATLADEPPEPEPAPA